MKTTKCLLLALMTLTLMTQCKESSVEQNPLLLQWDTPFQAPPFSQIKSEHFLPAIEQAIEQGRQQIDKITSNADEPTFENTIEALDFVNLPLERITSIFFNLNSSETSPELQNIELQLSPILTAYENDLSLNEKLFERVEKIYAQRADLNLTQEQSQLLDKTYKSFVRNGVKLSAEDKQKIRDISNELSQVSINFAQNNLAETNKFKLIITDSTQLDGLPEMVCQSAADDAKQAGEQGWIFTLHAPSYVPFMTYSNNRQLREQLWRAYNSKCFHGDSLDNQANVKRIAELRLQLANLMGYKTYADYVLEETMAQTPDQVNSLLGELLDKSKKYGQDEVAQIEQYANKQGLNGQLMPWDMTYYSERYKAEKYDISDEMTRPYFQLENVESAIFLLANKLYGITFKENSEIPIYQQDVRAFEVHDKDNELLAVLYIDYFPRPGKRSGAWMSDYRPAYQKDGQEVRPIITLVCNFTKPTATTPSLLSFSEVTTLLHEFGHGLHGILAKGQYPGLTGTSVYRDFVELPSQIMENWALEKEYLDLWAKHYQTGEKIPAQMVDNLIASKNHMAAYSNLRQLSFGMTDMAWHSISAPVSGSVVEFEKAAMAPTQLLPEIDGACFSTSFGHIFSGGYASGYYSYKWAEVLEADAFSKFKEAGIFDTQVAESFRQNILSKGGSQHPMTLYINFAGEKPTVEPLLKKMGLLKNS